MFGEWRRRMFEWERLQFLELQQLLSNFVIHGGVRDYYWVWGEEVLGIFTVSEFSLVSSITRYCWVTTGSSIGSRK